MTGSDEGPEWRKVGEFMITAHRQLPGLDREVRRACRQIDMSARKLRELMTSYRELTTNMIDHGGGGVLSWFLVTHGNEIGVGLVAEDRGPGIADVGLAMMDGYSSKQGLGLGLGGASRMMDHLAVDSTPSNGTKVTAIKWK